MTRRSTLPILIGLIGAVAASFATGSYIAGCVILGVTVEVGVICASFTAPTLADVADDDGDDGDGGGGGGWQPPDVPPDPWPPMSPEARDASFGEQPALPADRTPTPV